MSKHIDLIKIQEELGLRKEARVLIPGRPIKKMLGHLWKRYIKNPTVPHPHPTHKVDRIKRVKKAVVAGGTVKKADYVFKKHAGVMDAIHGGLDVLGMIPGVGIPFDLANAAIYTARKKPAMAALSAAAAIPVAGYAANAVKAGKHINTAVKAGKNISKTKKVLNTVKAPVQNTIKASRKAVGSTATGKKILDKADAVGKTVQTVGGKVDEAGKVGKTIRGAQTVIKGERATRPFFNAAGL